jgi:hypothetical protein
MTKHLPRERISDVVGFVKKLFVDCSRAIVEIDDEQVKIQTFNKQGSPHF